MLTDADIKKIIQAQEDVFPTKTDFDDLREDFSKLQTSVESFATMTKKHEEEISIINQRVGNHEDWIKGAGPKIGLDFKP